MSKSSTIRSGNVTTPVKLCPAKVAAYPCGGSTLSQLRR
jgi:hypothetical protein